MTSSPNLSLNELLQTLVAKPETIEFSEVIQVINENFDYQPTRFENGQGDNRVANEAGSNEGSCKIFALGQLKGFDEATTLACFGRHYRDDVLGNPDADNHANIRRFMQHGWLGIEFYGQPLTAKL